MIGLGSDNKIRGGGGGGGQHTKVVVGNVSQKRDNLVGQLTGNCVTGKDYHLFQRFPQQ